MRIGPARACLWADGRTRRGSLNLDTVCCAVSRHRQGGGRPRKEPPGLQGSTAALCAALAECLRACPLGWGERGGRQMPGRSTLGSQCKGVSGPPGRLPGLGPRTAAETTRSCLSPRACSPGQDTPWQLLPFPDRCLAAEKPSRGRRCSRASPGEPLTTGSCEPGGSPQTPLTM